MTDAQVKKDFDKQRKQSFPKDADYLAFLKSSGYVQEDLLYRIKIQDLSEKLRDEDPQGHRQGLRRADRQLLQQEQDPLRQPEKRDLPHRPDQDRGPGQEGQGGARGRPVVRAGRGEVLDRPGHEGQRRRPGGRPQGPAGEGAGRRDVHGAAEQGRGPVKTQFGYYVFEVTKITPGTQQTLATSKASIKQLLVSQKQQTEAQRVRQGLPEEVEGPDGVPQGLRDDRTARTRRRPSLDAGAGDHGHAAAERRRRPTARHDRPK